MNDERYLQFKSYIKDYVAARKADLKDKVEKFMDNMKIAPKLLIIQVGDNFASNKYVAGKIKDCKEVGISCEHYKFPEDVSEADLLMYIKSKEGFVDGIIVQLPLPKHINITHVTNSIPMNADVDGFKPGSPFVSCTPLGIYNLLMELFPDDKRLDGKNVVIIGRSDIVGKPMAKLLIEKTDSTVTVCNSHTKNLPDVCRQADILISAVGKAKFITEDFIKMGTTIIDVGINIDENGKMCGDVNPASGDLVNCVNFLTPVPGGVGLLTRLSLIENVYDAARYAR